VKKNRKAKPMVQKNIGHQYALPALTVEEVTASKKQHIDGNVLATLMREIDVRD
jgi:hypothetical protein